MTREINVLFSLVGHLVIIEFIYVTGFLSLYLFQKKRCQNLEKRLAQVVEDSLGGDLGGDQGKVEAAFIRMFEIMEKYLGGASRISCVTQADDSHLIYVHCLHCQKKNRLGKGLKGARCGQCKRLLSEPPRNYRGDMEEKHQVEATKKLVN